MFRVGNLRQSLSELRCSGCSGSGEGEQGLAPCWCQPVSVQVASVSTQILSSQPEGVTLAAGAIQLDSVAESGDEIVVGADLERPVFFVGVLVDPKLVVVELCQDLRFVALGQVQTPCLQKALESGDEEGLTDGDLLVELLGPPVCAD